MHAKGPVDADLARRSSRLSRVVRRSPPGLARKALTSSPQPWSLRACATAARRVAARDVPPVPTRRAGSAAARSAPRLRGHRVREERAHELQHMSDQYYGWWSRPRRRDLRPRGLARREPHLRCLTEGMPEGSFLRPELSYDGGGSSSPTAPTTRRLPASRTSSTRRRCRRTPSTTSTRSAWTARGSAGSTSGRYDDFDGRYLPTGEIVFLSPRRGRRSWASRSALASLLAPQPDSFVRCGGDAYRPVSVYTLHVMDADGGGLRAISRSRASSGPPPSARDGRVLYARWDYVDRSNMPYISLWSTTRRDRHTDRVRQLHA